MFVAIVVIAVLVVWLVSAVLVVALCVAAAEGDRQLTARLRRARRASRPVARRRFVPQR